MLPAGLLTAHDAEWSFPGKTVAFIHRTGCTLPLLALSRERLTLASLVRSLMAISSSSPSCIMSAVTQCHSGRRSDPRQRKNGGRIPYDGCPRCPTWGEHLLPFTTFAPHLHQSPIALNPAMTSGPSCWNPLQNSPPVLSCSPASALGYTHYARSWPIHKSLISPQRRAPISSGRSMRLRILH